MRPSCAVTVLLMLAGCGREPSHKEASPPATPVLVKTVTVAEADWPTTYEAVGSVRARTVATVSSKLMGYAKEVRAQVGDQVREGQVLVVLDARHLESSVSRAEAGRDELQSAIPEADSSITAAKAQLDLAQVTFNRMQDLFNKQSVTNQEFDEAATRLKAAQAGLDMARARRTQLNAKMAQVEQQVHAAGIERDYSQIVAPFAGTIMTKSVEPGTLAVPGASLFTIEGGGLFRFEASVEESRLALVRLGKAVSVTIDGIDRTVTARVAEIVPAVDPAARTGTVKIDLPALFGLRPGLFGRVLFATGARKALAVPKRAIIERGQLQSVYVAENNVAHLRLVTLGATADGKVEVLSGLHADERLILPIPADLTDGAPIEARP